MPVARTYSRAQLGVEAPLVTVEADIASGLPQIVIVGLPETAVRESKDRVKSALSNSGFNLPSRRVTINLAPADLPKQGGRYDLAIALAILAASDQIETEQIANREFLGELALNAELRSADGVLPAIIQSQQAGRDIIVPSANAVEASLIQHARAHENKILLSSSLAHTIQMLRGEVDQVTPSKPKPASYDDELKLSDVRGQYIAKRALIIAAAGGHNLLMMGPPGTGKTMLASRLPFIIPNMRTSEALEVAAVRSVSRHKFDLASWGKRPFRTPHHTASGVALVGGGNPPLPGEISLAHQGVLFLDELPEFSRHVLEVLREPLESGQIVISRANHQVSYPAQFQLIAAMNPCPCGYFGDETNRCTCRYDQIEKYRNKVSGPLLDRIDLHVQVPPLPKGALTAPTNQSNQEETETREMVKLARQRMLTSRHKLNAHLTGKQVEQACRLNASDRNMLDHAMVKLNLSARGYYKVLKVARTIADLSGEAKIETPHISEALGFRKLNVS